MSLAIDKSNWNRVAFGQVVASVNETLRDPGARGINRVIAMEHMDPGELRLDRWGSLEDGTTFTRRVKPGQTLFGKRRAYQRKVAFADFDAICSGDILTFEANPVRMLPAFLPFLVQSNPFFDHALGTSAGSLSPRTNWRDLATFKFDLPPLDEQKRIAALLWAAETERRAISGLSDELERARDRVRSSAFDSLSAPLARFDSVCVIPSQNGLALKKSERAGDVPMVNMGEMFRGEVISTNSEYERVVRPPGSFLLEEGDLLFARRSIVFEGAGACCLVPATDEPWTFESSVIRSRANREVVDPQYLAHFFRSDRGREVMATIVRRGPVSGISGSDLRKLEVPLPPADVQRGVVRAIDAASAFRPVLFARRQGADRLMHTLIAGILGGD